MDEPTIEDRLLAIEELLPVALAVGHLSAADLLAFAGKWRDQLAQRAAITLHPTLHYPTSDQALALMAEHLEKAAEARQQILRGPGV